MDLEKFINEIKELEEARDKAIADCDKYKDAVKKLTGKVKDLENDVNQFKEKLNKIKQIIEE